MAKRMTDTDKWKKRFVRDLSPQHKLLWFYILDDCNHAGIWEVDIEVASIRVGYELVYDMLPESFLDKIVIFDNGVEKVRFGANIMFQLEADKKTIQNSVDTIILNKFQ